MLLKLGTENRERGTGVWERVYSGDWPENPKWQTKKKKRLKKGRILGNMRMSYSCNCEFPLAVPNAFLLEQSLIGTGINIV